MARRGKSQRVARGIFQDDTGYRAQASFRGKKRERRFPLGTSLRKMQAWQESARTELRKGRVIFRNAAGTLSADIRRYLSQVKHLVGYKSRRSELHAWAQLYPRMDRAYLEPEDVRRAVSVWLTGDPVRDIRKCAPKTVRNRLVALASLYHMLDQQPGERTPPSPTDGITVAVQKRRPAYVTTEIIRLVVENLKQQEQSKTGRKKRGRLLDAKTRARFMVMAATGIRPAMLKRVQPGDVDLERRTWMVAGAKGGEPIGFYLNDDMLAAWEVFVQADAWGEYDTRSMARVLRTAGWPKGIRPYNARHSIGQDLSEHGTDYRDIADWLGHADPETTRQFYVPILTGRMRAMSDRLNGRLGWVPQGVPQKS